MYTHSYTTGELHQEMKKGDISNLNYFINSYQERWRK